MFTSEMQTGCLSQVLEICIKKCIFTRSHFSWVMALPEADFLTDFGVVLLRYFGNFTTEREL